MVQKRNPFRGIYVTGLMKVLHPDHLTSKEFAHTLGVGTHSLQAYTSGRNRMPIQKVEILIKLLRKYIEDLTVFKIKLEIAVEKYEQLKKLEEEFERDNI